MQLDIEKIGEHEYRVDALASLDRMFEYFGMNGEDSEMTTVNGWVMEHTDKIPAVGDSFDYENLHVAVISVDGRRADKIQITVKEDNTEDSNGTV